jgi:hypothetical protein
MAAPFHKQLGPQIWPSLIFKVLVVGLVPRDYHLRIDQIHNLIGTRATRL